MNIQKTKIELTRRQRNILLVMAILALVGPNALYLYYAVTEPELNQAALSNPISLAFMIEAMMLLGLFLWYVYLGTRSWVRVGLYLVLAFMGSLAFSLPMYLYRRGGNGSKS